MLSLEHSSLARSLALSLPALLHLNDDIYSFNTSSSILVHLQLESKLTPHFVHEEECIYVLSGSGELVIENDIYPFETGDFVGFPANTASHSLANTGGETLVCLVIGQRLKQDVGIYTNKGKKIYSNNGVWDLVDSEHINDPRKKQKNRTGIILTDKPA